MALIGGYFWSTSRSAPIAGALGVAADPLPGQANVLQVNAVDRYGIDHAAVLTTIAEGDQVSLAFTGVGTFELSGVVDGTPTIVGAVHGFPFTVRDSFDPDDEPPNRTVTTIFYTVATDWPTAEELAQVLDIENVSDWETTIDATLAAAIATVKSNVGGWDDAADIPTVNLNRAALRMAVLYSQQPGLPTAALVNDRTYQMLLTGQRRRFGIA